MNYIATVDTDIGIVKKTNQDSLLMKHGKCELGEIVLAIVCDGMGGLDKGEVASATIIKHFESWFEKDLPYELENLDMGIIAASWELMLKDLNLKILEYGQKEQISLGTTFTGMLCVDKEYLIVHIGDSRVYYLGDELKQMTTDHTLMAREISRGNLTPEQAKTDKRRNVLLQCVGATSKIEPEILKGTVKEGVYILCSDGFRHEISEKEIYDELKAENLKNKNEMHQRVKRLINCVKERKERDNISVIAIKADEEV